jgi:oligopeptide transport system substrate-binding protein
MYRFALGWSATLAALLFFTLRAGREDPPDFVLNNDDEVHSLDPAIAAWVHDIRAATGLFEGLTRLNPKTLRPEPAAATHWDRPDPRTYVFHLRDGLRWANHVRGDLGPVTAADFVFAWKRVLDPGTESEYYNLMFLIRGAEDYFKISQAYSDAKTATEKARLAGEMEAAWEKVGIKALDDKRLRVELVAPTAYFLELTAFITFMPVNKDAVGTGAEDSNESQKWTLKPETFVGNGPYLLAQRAIQRRLRYVKNPYYWDAANVKSNILDLLPIKNQTTALLAYEGGYVDLIPKVEERVARTLDRRAREDPSRKRDDLHLTPAYGTYFYRFNCKSEIAHPDTGKLVPNPLADARVRTALSLVVDRRKLTDELLGLNRQPMAGFVPPDSIDGYPGFTYDHARDYDPARAGKLLDEAGFTDRRKAPPIVIRFNDDEMHAKIALFIREAWAGLGLDVRVEAVEFKTFSQMINSINFTVARSGWFGDYGDPMTFLEMFHSNDGHNQTGFRNADYDTLIEDARVEPNEKLRRGMLEKAERMLVFDHRPLLPLFRYVDSAMAKPNVRGYYPNPRGQIDVKYLYKE